MNKNEMLNVLRREGITIKEEEGSYVEVTQDYEYYSELLQQEDEWKLILNKRGNIEEKASFKTESEAIRYFFLYEIKVNIIMKKNAMLRRNTDILYSDDVKIEDIIKVVENNNISEQFYNKEGGYSINIVKKGDMYDVYLNNPDAKRIYGTLKLLNRKDACMIIFNWIFSIALFIGRYSEYLKEEIVTTGITDEDVAFMLDGRK